MNERTDRRTELNLTQTDAARLAAVSLATWRRWEDDPDSVSAKTRAACQGVLDAATGPTPARPEFVAQIERAWLSRPDLTPRQAYSITVTLDGWADTDLTEWLRDPSDPLYDVGPCAELDLRVMMHVGESRAWAEAVRRRCYALADEVRAGTLPFDRPGCYMDELLLGATIPSAKAWMQDMPDLFEPITARSGLEDEESEEYSIGDDDWEHVVDGWDDRAEWEDWEVPLLVGHPRVAALLAERHPFTWLDNTHPGGIQ